MPTSSKLRHQLLGYISSSVLFFCVVVFELFSFCPTTNLVLEPCFDPSFVLHRYCGSRIECYNQVYRKNVSLHQKQSNRKWLNFHRGIQSSSSIILSHFTTIPLQKNSQLQLHSPYHSIVLSLPKDPISKTPINPRYIKKFRQIWHHSKLGIP